MAGSAWYRRLFFGQDLSRQLRKPSSCRSPGSSMFQSHGYLAAPRLAVPTEPPKASSDDIPPIMRLPFELMLSIFRNCDPDIKSRLRLTHTSQCWMSVTSQTASLWTSVHMEINYPAEDERFDRLLSLLETQLDRAAGMPLDVVWASNQPTAFDPRLIGLLRRKGPFSQWRTLQLQLRDFPPGSETVFSPEDAFTNLESIFILPSAFNCVISALNRTTTSRLQVLKLRRTRWLYEVTLEDYMGMARHISRLKTNAIDIGPLPKNVIHLEARNQSCHEFPQLETYQLRACAFRNDRKIDLGHLTSLDVANIIYVQHACEVSLPSLRQLRCGTIFLPEYAKIRAPALTSLYISGKESDADGNHSWTDIMKESIWSVGYLLSRSSLLSVGMLLPDDCLGKLLELSSRVSKVEMGFRDEGCAIRLLERISMVDMGDTQREGETLCEQLTDLRLTFRWDFGDVGSWRDRAARVVENRLRFGISLRIYAS